MEKLLAAAAPTATSIAAGTPLLSPSSSTTAISPVKPKSVTPIRAKDGGVVVNSGEGSFVVHYLGATMLDAQFEYTDAMMPWLVAEILRFTEDLQALLMIKNHAVIALCRRTGRPLFEAHVLDFLRHMAIVSDTSSSSSSSSKGGSGGSSSSSGAVDGRFYFLLIFRTNATYLHCRLLSASSQQQVNEIMNTMHESARHCAQTQAAIRPSALPTPTGLGVGHAGSRLLTDLPSAGDSMSFEVFYLGKLRMTTRKAPASFIDDAIQQFKTHEQNKLQQQQQEQQEQQKRMENQNNGSNQMETITIGRNNSQESSDQDKGSQGPIDSIHNVNNGNANQNPTISLSTCENNNSLTPAATRTSPARFPFSHPLQDPSQEQGEDVLSPLAPHPSNKSGYHLNLNQANSTSRTRTASGDTFGSSASGMMKSLSLPVEPMRTRALSTGHSPRTRAPPSSPSLPTNRTMLLILCRSEVRIISPDAKSVLLNKPLQDICHLARGVNNPACFGFICKENERISHSYVGFVFRCDSDSIADEVLKVLRQAHSTTQEEVRKGDKWNKDGGGGGSGGGSVGVCEHCPMRFFHLLCTELEGLSDEKMLATIQRHVECLPEPDRVSILAKFGGAEASNVSEQVELYMMLLRAHCESKQHKHTHDSLEGRHEFINQYLGGGAILLKARRSIAQSFDQLLKSKKNSTSQHHTNQPSMHMDSPSPLQQKQQLYRGDSVIVSDSPISSVGPGGHPHRARSSTIGALSSERVRCENMRIRKHTPTHPQSSSSRDTLDNAAGHTNANSTTITSIFAKQTLPKQAAMAMHSPAPLVRRQGWRQAIFKRVVSPQSTGGSMGLQSPVVTFSGGYQTPTGGSKYPHAHTPSSRSRTPGTPATPATPRRSRAQLRELWRTAIRQQILLLRMEKQNFMLRAQQEEVTVKRSKMHYLELGTCDEEATETWDLLISQCAARKCDTQILSSALRRGVPKAKRGAVWQLFMEQNRLGGNPNSTPPDTPYEELIRKLTSQQHAILIDLGRTFPNHEYFSGPLGAGQLALFNLLKAYSLLDPAVGYCQGLSFVAGLLLMHLEEEEAFEALRYLMFELGGREHYLANMLGLQVRMYQLTRLIHDQDADVHLLLHHNDVHPSLYAAPWFLTLFSSQFPLGFAVRVLDVVMLHGFDVLVPFALSLVVSRRQQLLQCSGLEAVMECFKAEVTQVTSDELDAHLRRVLEFDWEKQLLTYAVEYSVMHDDSFVALVNHNNDPRPTLLRPPSSNANSLNAPPPIREEPFALEQNYDILLQHVTLLEGLLLGAGLNVPQRPKLAPLSLSPSPTLSPAPSHSPSMEREEGDTSGGSDGGGPSGNGNGAGNKETPRSRTLNKSVSII